MTKMKGSKLTNKEIGNLLKKHNVNIYQMLGVHKFNILYNDQVDWEIFDLQAKQFREVFDKVVETLLSDRLSGEAEFLSLVLPICEKIRHG